MILSFTMTISSNMPDSHIFYSSSKWTNRPVFLCLWIVTFQTLHFVSISSLSIFAYYNLSVSSSRILFSPLPMFSAMLRDLAYCNTPAHSPFIYFVPQELEQFIWLVNWERKARASPAQFLSSFSWEARVPFCSSRGGLLLPSYIITFD